MIKLIASTVFTFIALQISVHAGNFAVPDKLVQPARQLKSFRSKAELRRYLKRLQRKSSSIGVGFGAGMGDGNGPGTVSSVVTVTADAAVSVPGIPMPMEETRGAGGGGREEDEVITNVQTAGVDEGGIVKLHRNYLVILRRGRLFTVDISNGGLRTVSTINAYGPDIDPDDTWYDEMLISGDNIVVVGFSYERGGTEVGLFKIGRDGSLSYRYTYHMRSDDYYSSRNYSSRLIGDRLIFYAPLSLEFSGDDVFDSFPAVRRWHKGASEKEFVPISRATETYVPSGYTPDPNDTALHTVTTCTIGDALTCRAATIIGPSGHVFYVSAKNVYVWASLWYPEEEAKSRNRSFLFKMPLAGTPPSAVRVSGSPVDQLSFHEEAAEELNVLVRSEGKGDGMWRSEVAEGEVALLSLSPSSFNDGSAAARRRDYEKLEDPGGYSFQNRFIGDYVLYGASDFDDEKPATQVLYAYDRRSGTLAKLPLQHDVQRIDLLGPDAIVVGNAGSDLKFSSVRLGNSPEPVHSYTVEHAEQGETRTQGFFYKPVDPDNGILGLPVLRRSSRETDRLAGDTASVFFLKTAELRFEEFGELTATDVSRDNDDCKASCVDWYGNARPIFARGRVFALLGYELVEGTERNGRLSELRRLNFTPKL